MLLIVELVCMALLLGGMWLLTVGSRRFNITHRVMTITFAVTAVSWMAFLLITIALVVFATVQLA